MGHRDLIPDLGQHGHVVATAATSIASGPAVTRIKPLAGGDSGWSRWTSENPPPPPHEFPWNGLFSGGQGRHRSGDLRFFSPTGAVTGCPRWSHSALACWRFGGQGVRPFRRIPADFGPSVISVISDSSRHRRRSHAPVSRQRVPRFAGKLARRAVDSASLRIDDRVRRLRSETRTPRCRYERARSKGDFAQIAWSAPSCAVRLPLTAPTCGIARPPMSSVGRSVGRLALHGDLGAGYCLWQVA